MTSTTSKRSRRPDLIARRACDYCYRRKIKCDGNSPCEQCIKKERLCEWERPEKKRGRPAAASEDTHNFHDSSEGSKESSDEDTTPFASPEQPSGHIVRNPMSELDTLMDNLAWTNLKAGQGETSPKLANGVELQNVVPQRMNPLDMFGDVLPLPEPAVLNKLIELFRTNVLPVFPGLFDGKVTNEPLVLYSMLSNASRFDKHLAHLSDYFFEKAEQILIPSFAQGASIDSIRSMALLMRHLGLVANRWDLAQLVGSICFAQAKIVPMNPLAKKELFELDQILAMMCGSQPCFDETWLDASPKNPLFILLHRILGYRLWLKSPALLPSEAKVRCQQLDDQLDAWYATVPEHIRQMDEEIQYGKYKGLDANGKFQANVDQEFVARSLIFYYFQRVLLHSPLSCSLSQSMREDVSLAALELESQTAHYIKSPHIPHVISACRHEAALLGALTDIKTQFGSSGSTIYYSGLVYGLTVKAMIRHTLHARILLPSAIAHLTRHASVLKDLSVKWNIYNSSSHVIWALVGELQRLQVMSTLLA